MQLWNGDMEVGEGREKRGGSIVEEETKKKSVMANEIWRMGGYWGISLLKKKNGRMITLYRRFFSH